MKENREPSAADNFFAFLNQCIPWLIGVFLFFNPFHVFTAVEEIAFYGATLAAVILVVARKWKPDFRTPLSCGFVLFTLWAVFGLFFALNFPNSLHDIYAHLLKYLAFYYLLVSFFNSREKFLAAISVIVLSVSLYALWLMGFFYIVMNHPFHTRLWLEMPGGNATNIIAILCLYGAVLAIWKIPHTARLWEKSLLCSAFLILAVTTLATQSRSVILAAIIFVAISSFRNPKRGLLLLGIAVLLFAAMPAKRFTPSVFLDKIHTHSRIHVLALYGEILKSHPIVGIGFGMQTYYDEGLLAANRAKVSEAYRPAALVKAPHNLLMDVAVRTGIIGLLLFLFIIYRFLKMAWLLIRCRCSEFIRDWALFLLAAFSAVFFLGLFENTLSGPPAVILYSIFAMMTILWRMQNDPQGAAPDDVQATGDAGKTAL